MAILRLACLPGHQADRSFLLQRVQPAMTGPIDGAVIPTISAAPGAVS